jgi:aminoglycoside phosphotransferase (APT) family kinase protein
VDDEHWSSYFRERGHDRVRRLGHGMEGTVFSLGDGMVAKVWSHRSAAELEPVRAFYAELRAADPAVRTPYVLSVEDVGGTAVSVEEHLDGALLQERIPADAGHLPRVAVDAVGRCLEALRDVPATPASRALPVLGEPRPFRTAGDTFTAALLDLVERRVAAAEGPMVAAVPDLARRCGLLRDRLAELAPVADTVLHGDLFGKNVLVDAFGEPTAMLDFGFLTTAGDPRLDAAITSGVMDMYGAHADDITAATTDRLADRLGYDRDVLVLYRAAYAAVTCTLFGDGPHDGHFRWCVRRLLEPATSHVLGL